MLRAAFKFAMLLLMVGPAFGSSKLKCGTERWAVKTLADTEADQVEEEVIDTTVKQMLTLAAPTDLQKKPDYRHDPVEFTQYRIHALLIAYKQEKDEDYHLVLADQSDPSLTLVAEIPSASCMAPEYASLVGQEQNWVNETFGRPLGVGRLKHLSTPQAVIVQGVAFFDIHNAGHSPTGSAQNGIEIHPVLKITLEAQ